MHLLACLSVHFMSVAICNHQRNFQLWDFIHEGVTEAMGVTIALHGF